MPRWCVQESERMVRACSSGILGAKCTTLARRREQDTHAQGRDGREEGWVKHCNRPTTQMSARMSVRRTTSLCWYAFHASSAAPSSPGAAAAEEEAGAAARGCCDFSIGRDKTKQHGEWTNVLHHCSLVKSCLVCNTCNKLNHI